MNEICININATYFDKQTKSILVLCSDTVKEPAAVPVIVGCKNTPFYYRSGAKGRRQQQEGLGGLASIGQ